MSTASAPAGRAPSGATLGRVLAGALGAGGLALLAALLLALVVFAGQTLNREGSGPTTVYGVSDWALKDIPPKYLALYQQAADAQGIDWAILAGIGSRETDHGRLNAPGVTSGANSYGCCGGPMQFYFTQGLHRAGRGPQIQAWGRVRVGKSSPETWGRYGVDGDGDGWKDVWDEDDAIPAAAAYLKASGAPDYQRAIFAYNHAQWYVDDVLARAERYRGSKSTVLPGNPGTQLVPGAPLVPVEGGDRFGALITAMNQLEAAKIPYCYGGGHGLTPARPSAGQYCWGGNPLRKQTGTGDVGLDCSSSTSWLLQRIGYRLTTMTSGSFMSWGEPGPGRRVTIWTNPEHVYLEVKVNGRSYYFGTSTENYRHGPGWHSPRSGSGFVARHPEGL